MVYIDIRQITECDQYDKLSNNSYAKNFIIKTLSNAPKLPLKITKFVANITYCATIW